MCIFLYGRECWIISSMMEKTLSDIDVVLPLNVKNTLEKLFKKCGNFMKNKNYKEAIDKNPKETNKIWRVVNE